MATFPIVFQNDEIIIVNKPNGVSVQGGAGISHPLDKELSAQVGYPLHLVHRLDKETSGLLVVAKNAASAAKWTGLIAGGQVKKEYSAICIGLPISGKKSFGVGQKGVLRDVVIAHGREQPAELFFTVESAVSLPEVTMSFLKIRLGTGRMHQIRIQLAKASCPIAADDQHGNFKLNKILRRYGIKRLCLAASKITLPLDGETREFSVPLPEHMQRALEACGLSE
ncbi:MAG: RluA family pseudouridine synthase [Treponema sp.]|nr:RluA family pseudouridine synthase [Treponema sp.]